MERVRWTPLVSSRVCLASASDLLGGSPPSRRSGESSLHADRDRAVRTAAARAEAARLRGSTGVSLAHRRGPRPDRRRPRSAGCRARRSRPAGRRPPGSSTGAPLAAAARAGAVPAQAKTRASSPLRNRWQRTPPVARPLAGYSENGVTLTRAGLGAGQRRRGAGGRDHDRALGCVRVDRAEPRHPLARGDPDAGHAAAGAALGPDRVGAEVQQLGVGGEEAEALASRWSARPRRRPRRRPRAGSPPSRPCRGPPG